MFIPSAILGFIGGFIVGATTIIVVAIIYSKKGK